MQHELETWDLENENANNSSFSNNKNVEAIRENTRREFYGNFYHT